MFSYSENISDCWVRKRYLYEIYHNTQVVKKQPTNSIIQGLGKNIIAGLFLGLRPTNESYFVTTSLIGWAQA